MELSDLQWFHWLIVGVPLLAIVGFGLWVLIFGARPRLPPGLRVEAECRGFRVTLVFHDTVVLSGVLSHEANRKLLARRCAEAVWVTADAFELRTSTKAEEIVEMAINFTTAKQDSYLAGAAAYLTHARAFRGGGVPLAVVSTRYVDEIKETGEPVIHECLHALLGQYSEPDQDRDHSHHEAWKANSGEDSWQAEAQRRFQGLT